MRIRTDGDYEYRKDTIESAKQALDENTNTAAVIAACDHAAADVAAKQKAMEYLVDEVEPEVAAEVAELLSTSTVTVDYTPPDASVSVE